MSIHRWIQILGGGKFWIQKGLTLYLLVAKKIIFVVGGWKGGRGVGEGLEAKKEDGEFLTRF